MPKPTCGPTLESDEQWVRSTLLTKRERCVELCLQGSCYVMRGILGVLSNCPNVHMDFQRRVFERAVLEQGREGGRE